jgi:hypothetical protein
MPGPRPVGCPRPRTDDCIKFLRVVKDEILATLQQIVQRAPPRTLQRAFPDSQYPPPLTLEARQSNTVAFHVPADFPPPELFAGLWPSEHRAVVRMPETAMHENYSSVFREHKVRPTRQVLTVEAKTKTPCMQSAPDNHLGSSVTSPYPGHIVPALFLREDVRHRITPRGRPDRRG